jgi:hypothetical protein
VGRCRALDLASGLRLSVVELAAQLLAHEKLSRPPPPVLLVDPLQEH